MVELESESGMSALIVARRPVPRSFERELEAVEKIF